MDGRVGGTAGESLRREDEVDSPEGFAVGLGARDGRSGVDDDAGRRRDGVVAGRRGGSDGDDGDNGAPCFPSLPESESRSCLVSPTTRAIGNAPRRVGWGMREARGEGTGRRDGGGSRVAMAMARCMLCAGSRRRGKRREDGVHG